MKEILSKEEIWEAEINKDDDLGWSGSAMNAMGVWAKQEAIEFAEFLKDNSYTKGKDGWYKYFTQRTDYPAGFSMSMPVYNFLTLENIYDVFLQSKQK